MHAMITVEIFNENFDDFLNLFKFSNSIFSLRLLRILNFCYRSSFVDLVLIDLTNRSFAFSSIKSFPASFNFWHLDLQNLLAIQDPQFYKESCWNVKVSTRIANCPKKIVKAPFNLQPSYSIPSLKQQHLWEANSNMQIF